MAKLILMRHGESLWNKRNLFTGWVDVPLTMKGIDEAVQGGKLFKHIPIDIIFTTTLIRAQMTAMIAMAEHDQGKTPVVMHDGEEKLEEWSQIYGKEAQNIIPVIRAWELNERMYGELQGLNKAETAEKFGSEQVLIWRRSFNVAPPNGESLEMTAARSIPYFTDTVEPLLKQGKTVLIAAHGNSLRSIIMHLDKLSKEEVLHLELATGHPIIYDYQAGTYSK